MCTIHNIRLLNLIFSFVKAIFALYVFGVGVTFAEDTLVQQGFGIKFASMGAGLAMLGLMSGCIIPVHLYSVKRHNRFLLMVAFLTDLLVMSLLLYVGMDIGTYTVSSFDKGLQIDCSRVVPLEYTPEECEPFFRSGRTAGFRMAWEALYNDRNNTISFQTLTTLEGRECCGYFAPSSCIPDEQKFPPDRPTDGILSSQLKQRVTCGNKPTYYIVQRDCLDFFDPAAVPPIIGGCNYDMGLGFCLTKDITEDSSGCAAAMEDYMVSLIGPHGVMLMVSTTFNIVSMLVACCMFWKRKEMDVFPEFRAPKVPRNHLYQNVKEPYEIVPNQKVLVIQGFIPEEVDDLPEESLATGASGEGGSSGAGSGDGDGMSEISGA
jgi:hypothetical protein